MSNEKKQFLAHFQRYVLTGILTVIPLWITWVVFKFAFGQLSQFGLPWVRALGNALDNVFPSLGQLLLQPWFQSLLAIIFTLLAFYLLGWAVTQVAGRRLLALFDDIMHRIPMVQTIYGGTKKLLSVLQQKPENLERVVLIEFPNRHMKTVGFVTRLFTDQKSGRQLAAVYVPTTPNPTSGYLEIVPVERLISTDWSLDEAMTFIISGGAVAPDRIPFEEVLEKPEQTGTDR